MKKATRKKLTTLVDGELTPAQQEAVLKLLRESADAKHLLRQLQRDAEHLRALPRDTLASDFANQVLQHIRQRGLKPYSTKTYVRAPGWQWVAAALVLVGIGLGTFYLLQDIARLRSCGTHELTEQPEQVTPIATDKAIPGKEVTPIVPGPEDRDHADHRLAWNELRRHIPTAEEMRNSVSDWWETIRPIGENLQTAIGASTQSVASAVLSPFENPDGWEAPFRVPDLLTFPPGNGGPLKSPFKTIDVQLPLFLDTRNLQTDKLLERFQGDNFHYFDLSCGESWKAFERFQTALRTAGLKVIVDTEITQRLEKKAPTRLMIYLEELTPGHVVRLLEALQAADQGAEEKKKGDFQFRSIMVHPLDAEGRRRLADSLGVPVNSLPPLRASGATNPQAAEKALTGQGGQDAKRAHGVALVYYPHRGPNPASADVRRFFDIRPNWQPDAIHVVLVLRPRRG
jgi:hypothetical protein